MLVKIIFNGIDEVFNTLDNDERYLMLSPNIIQLHEDYVLFYHKKELYLGYIRDFIIGDDNSLEKLPDLWFNEITFSITLLPIINNSTMQLFIDKFKFNYMYHKTIKEIFGNRFIDNYTLTKLEDNCVTTIIIRLNSTIIDNHIIHSLHFEKQINYNIVFVYTHEVFNFEENEYREFYDNIVNKISANI